MDPNVQTNNQVQQSNTTDPVQNNTTTSAPVNDQSQKAQGGQNSLYDYLKSKGLPEASIFTFFTFVMPIIQERIEVLYSTVYTFEEIAALEDEIEAQGLDPIGKALAYANGYKVKTGKDIQDEINKIINDIIDIFEKAQFFAKKYGEETAKLPEDQQDKHFEESLKKFIEENNLQNYV